ncbi:MAG: hypothetical protein IID33_03790 [Planctomycetes bacterium]|nr:hypothetical protein [Planctomycetota bacterium]
MRREGNAHYYAFAPNQLGDLHVGTQAFERGPHWRSVRNQFIWMSDECRKKAIRFVVVYAPSKAHVALPTIADRLPAEKVARFTAISYDEGLPRPAIFLEHLMKNIDARETVARHWCADERGRCQPDGSLARGRRCITPTTSTGRPMGIAS